jgi:hypothetical protein
MRKSELPELSTRLAQLADALASRAPSTAGLAVWLDALAECAMADVLAVLVDWPKSHAKMPLPADVLRLCRDRMTDRTERQAAEFAKSARAQWSPEKLRGDTASPQYLAFRRALATGKRRERPHPKAWAHKLRDREAAGEQLLSTASDAWRAALRMESPPAPADLDDEALAERLAIRAEACA